MSSLAVRRIGTALTKLLSGKIDMSDMVVKSADQQRTSFLSRAVAAYSLVHLAGIDSSLAGKSVVDGMKDNGIDAIYFDSSNQLLYLVQSKWMASGVGSPVRGDVQKFVKGFHDLVNARFDRFNDKVKARQKEVTRALDDTNVKFVLVLAYTGHNPISPESQSDLDDLLKEENDPVETVTFRAISQRDLIWAVSGEADGEPVTLEVMLHDWGMKREPYLSYYGQVSAEDIAGWYDKYQERLFAKNLRQFKSKTDVNQGLEKTLRSEPEHFWYFNNGITVLCGGIGKKRIGGAEKTSGVFVCDSASVVNGAQTVGSIHSAYKVSPDVVKKATVTVRFISVEHCPEDFVTEVTRATNTQNRIERRDFAALDPEQARLKTDLWALDVEYVYKSGEAPPPQDKGFTIDDATVALACAAPETGLAVQAKREIGKLWEDVSRAPYKLLFNSSTSGLKVWRCVEILRSVNEIVEARQKKLEGRDRMVAVHGNLMIAHMVFRRLPLETFDDEDFDLESVRAMAKIEASTALAQLIAGVAQHVPTASYLNSFFKNATRCKDLLRTIESTARAKSKATKPASTKTTPAKTKPSKKTTPPKTTSRNAAAAKEDASDTVAAAKLPSSKNTGRSGLSQKNRQ